MRARGEISVAPDDAADRGDDDASVDGEDRNPINGIGETCGDRDGGVGGTGDDVGDLRRRGYGDFGRRRRNSF